MKESKIIIYTDGAARGNPGPAGWAAVVIFHDDKLKVKSGKLKVVEIGGRVEHATNNQMELTAAIEALKFLKQKRISGQIEIISDSKYVILGITEWIFNWMRKNWRSASKKRVMNRELWEELDKFTEKFKLKWTYVEGHNGDKYNDRADEIATSFADNEPVKLKK